MLRLAVLCCLAFLWGGTPASATTTTTSNPKENKGKGQQYDGFVAYNESRTCSADGHVTPFNSQLRGVNMGGWMELEPWITPSLFYQFLGNNENNTAMDIFTFCTVLGPEEGNIQLHRHWSKWITRDIVLELGRSGLNSVRLPVGDFIFHPYGPYVGCVDGGADYVDQFMEWALEAKIEVLIDIHCLRHSQNGFDNSGQAMEVKWTSNVTRYPMGLVTFEHWPIQSAHWMGYFDPYTLTYPDIDWENINFSLKTIEIIAERYKDAPAVLGLEPVNEPWQNTPLEALKQYYWEGYLIVKRIAPRWKYVMHDSFRFSTEIWGGFMAGCPDRALDTHIYQAWFDPASRASFYANACAQSASIVKMEKAFGPVVVGEWSLATDNCAMWLNGFNDNLNGYPKLPCKFIKCGKSYLGPKQPGTPLDPSLPLQGPFGTGVSGPIYGMCPVDRDWYKESAEITSSAEWVLLPPKAPKPLDDTAEVRSSLAKKKIEAFSFAHGMYFWNFRTEIYEPTWNYLAAVKEGWMPTGNFDTNEIRESCKLENSGAFVCVCKEGQLDIAIQRAMAYCLNVDHNYNQSWVYNLTGKALRQQASILFNDYFHKYRLLGGTCDFGGVAALELANRTVDSGITYNDDAYFAKVTVTVSKGPPIWVIVVGSVGAALVGSIIGFLVAMNYSPAFNKRVRESGIFEPLRKSNNIIARSSLSLLALADEYDPIPDANATAAAAAAKKKEEAAVAATGGALT
eukprot:CAMPEP_0116830220 /NCGR_PEP_ID=MMETSP0418-20121206/4645_1 /TAXON_ID=1158023 /ORGANISM="Astrosyne radiata, Strain 13vi08-1A" /LENGTH=737 /DNA_ID=CAMNT_0004459305 /DNA_START=108 /DNA_END=2321 /DNA_ORIENTATION=-